MACDSALWIIKEYVANVVIDLWQKCQFVLTFSFCIKRQVYF